MYNYKIGNKEITFKINLGVIKRLEAKLKRPYQKIMEDFDSLIIEDKLAFLWLCAEKDPDNVFPESAFTELCLDNLSSSELLKILSILVRKDQQPTKSIEEIEKEYEKNLEDAENFQKTAMEQLMKKTFAQ